MLDWQTEEEQTWEDEPTPPPPTAVSPWPRRLVWLTLLLLLGGGIWYGTSFLSERVETAADETEADLRQAHALLREAALNQDVELFILLISGRDEAWAEAQELLLRRGFMLDRLGWGLTHERANTANDRVTDITLSPDLLAAEVTAVESYQFWSVADQQVKTAPLQYTVVYRLGPDRWLYAPPEPEFWGETAEITGNHLRITYPERDQEVVERLLPNLDALMTNTCRLPGIETCDTLAVELTTDPASLAQSLSRTIINADEPIVLPTPTLLGLPQDAAGYEALWLAYGRFLSSTIITRQNDYACCQRVQIYAALLHYQLSQLGLLDWPTDLATSPQIHQSGQAYQQELLANLWQGTAPYDWRPFLEPDGPDREQLSLSAQMAYLLVDYLVPGQNSTPAVLQNALPGFEELLDWYNAISPATAQSEDHLVLLLADHASRQQAAPPQLPDPLTVTCDPNGPAPRLSYDPTTRTWQERPLPPLANPDWSQPTFRQIHPIPHTDLYLLETADTLYLASDGLLRPIQFDRSLTSHNRTLYITAAPDGQLLNLTWEQLQRNQRFTGHYQLDPTACDDEACPITTAPGEISWSPNGRYTLITINEWQALEPGPGLYLGDEQGNVVAYLGDHYDRLRPVWLDDAHIAYPILSENEAAHYEILAVGEDSAGDNSPLLTITPDDLHQAIPEPLDPLRPIQPIQLLPSPNNPHHLFIQAAKPWIRGQVGSGVAYEQHYLFWAELSADFTQIERLAFYRQSQERPLAVAIAPQGQAVISYAIAVNHYEIVTFNQLPLPLRDPTFGRWPLFETLAAIPPTWSPDGEWLALAYPFGLLLTDMQTMSHIHLASYDLSNCTAVQWVPER